MFLNMNKQPLVSFIVIAYNQEKYIEEAIRGAFSQTYEPLEIILSDDSSPDKTFEIMQRLAEEYDGPHKVVLNRNESNLGIGGHINRVMELSQGEFIVINAGDDTSLPDRLKELVIPWLENKNRKLIYSNSILIDLDGNEVGESYDEADLSNKSLTNIIEKNLCCSGATVGIDKDVYGYFGPLLITTRHEDRAWATRAKLLGDIYHVDKQLIKYRVEGGVSRGELSKLDWLGSKSISWYRNFIYDYQQKIQDLNIYHKKNPSIKNIYTKTLNARETVLLIKLKLASNEMTLRTLLKNKSVSCKVKFQFIIRFLVKKGLRIK